MEILIKISNAVKLLFSEEYILLLVALSLLSLNGIRRAIGGFRGRKNKLLDSFYYSLFVIAITVFALGSLLDVLVGNLWPIFGFIGSVGIDVAPAFLALHIWRQTSYLEIKKNVFIRYFSVPALIAVLQLFEMYGVFVPNPLSFLFGNAVALQGVGLKDLLLALYVSFMIVRSYLFCFNVFYQMPPHMQKSARNLLMCISLFATALIGGFVLSKWLAAAVLLIGLYFTMEMLYAAFFITNSSNVIATSRRFVFEGISSFVVVVSKKGRILDWNIKDGSQSPALPTPYFREPFDKYKERILKNNGRVSSHSENIISATAKDQEHNYQIVIHEIETQTRHFGQLVEIQEVTELYSLLHYFEDVAFIDHLTGLKNRNAYQKYMKTACVANNLPLGILTGDVNYLKRLNDSGGHLLGDKLLRTVADIVVQTVEEKARDEGMDPSQVFVSRVGGDELVILYPRGGEKAAADFVSRIKVNLEAACDDEIGTPSVSWGFSELTAVDQSYNEIFEIADRRMYADKERQKAGRDDVNSGFIPVRKVEVEADFSI
ncbi:hypothetical protein FACS1894111_02910 [Clostridia bacterium]|nr:hypothetical protein FACS1894111_02910 [Clostridia bacterium]